MMQVTSTNNGCFAYILYLCNVHAHETLGIIGFSFEVVIQQGAQEAHRAVPNEALYGALRICSLIRCTYLLECQSL